MTDREAELEEQIAIYKPYHDAIIWLQEHCGKAQYYTKWQLVSNNTDRLGRVAGSYADDFLEAFENLKNLVEGETNG